MIRFVYKSIFTFSKHMDKPVAFPPAKYKFYDIAANLTDDQFGSTENKEQHGHKHVEDDRDEAVERARRVGCSHLLIAAGCIQDATHSY